MPSSELPKALYERLVDACIEMNAGEIIDFDEDVFNELKRRKLIRRPRGDDSMPDGVDYVISQFGQQLADRVMKRRDANETANAE